MYQNNQLKINLILVVKKILKISFCYFIFSSIGQDVLPLDNNNFPAFKLFPQRSDSIDNSSNRASPSNNGIGINPKIPSPTDSDELDFHPLTISPFRLFGTSTTVSTANQNSPKTPTGNSLKKFSSTTDKPRRKRTPKIDDNTDVQKVKRRKSEMNMHQKQLTLTELQPPKPNLNPETSVAKVNRLIYCFIFKFLFNIYLKDSFKLS